MCPGMGLGLNMGAGMGMGVDWMQGMQNQMGGGMVYANANGEFVSGAAGNDATSANTHTHHFH